MRSVRGVGLVLVDERRGLVVVEVDVVRRAEHAIGAGLHGGVGRPRQHHEVLVRQVVAIAEDAVGASDQRIVRLQRDEDRAVAALVDQVEAVVEELAEEA